MHHACRQQCLPSVQYGLFILEQTVRSLLYTLPAGDPRMSEHSASRASLMFWNEPRMWIRVSATTMRVFVAFSIVNLVLPFCTTHQDLVELLHAATVLLCHQRDGQSKAYMNEQWVGLCSMQRQALDSK
jgi:hypothetical protein